MQSQAKTIKEYLSELEAPRAKDIKALIELTRKNIKPGFDETMRWGMISYEVPLSLSGPTYNKQPLNYIGIASQKHHISFYLMGIYAGKGLLEEFQSRWAKSGKKLDMGKGCVRFKTLEQADLTTLTWAIKQQSPKQLIELTPAHKAASAREKR